MSETSTCIAFGICMNGEKSDLRSSSTTAVEKGSMPCGTRTLYVREISIVLTLPSYLNHVYIVNTVGTWRGNNIESAALNLSQNKNVSNNFYRLTSVLCRNGNFNNVLTLIY